MSSSSSFLLKVLSGPHVGAELALRDGATIIGSDDECDVILSDTFIAPKHLKIEIKDGKLRAQALAENVSLDGKPLVGQAVDLANFQLLTVGGTHLMIGPKGMAWPQPKTQLLPALVGTAPAPAPAPAAATPAPSAPAPAAAPKASTSPVAAATPARKSRVGQTIGFIGLALAVIGLTLYYLLRPLPAPPIEVDLASAVKAKIKEIGMADRLTVDPQGSRVVIRGYVETAEEKRKALQALAPLLDRVTPRIISQEQLFDDARQLLRALKSPVEVIALEKGGVLQVRGIVPTRDSWNSVLMHLKKDVPGISKVNDEQVLTVDQLLTKVGEAVNESGLTGQVTPEWIGGALTVRGSIGDSAVPSWQGFRARLQEKLGFPLELRDQVRLASAPGIPGTVSARSTATTGNGSEIASIVLDRLNWVVLKNGKRLFAGSTLPSGYVVEGITPEGVKISNGRDARLLRVGDDLWQKP